VSGPVQNSQLAAGNPCVENAGRARRGHAIVFADQNERRLRDAAQVRLVIEVSVARVREVTEDVRNVDRVRGEVRRRLAGEVEGRLHPHELGAVLRRLHRLLPLPRFGYRLPALAHGLE
jgi:hypothetical protein